MRTSLRIGYSPRGLHTTFSSEKVAKSLIMPEYGHDESRSDSHSRGSKALFARQLKLLSKRALFAASGDLRPPKVVLRLGWDIPPTLKHGISHPTSAEAEAKARYKRVR